MGYLDQAFKIYEQHDVAQNSNDLYFKKECKQCQKTYGKTKKTYGKIIKTYGKTNKTYGKIKKPTAKPTKPTAKPKL